MLDWIAGRVTRFTIMVVCVILIGGGLASRVQAGDVASDWPTGRQFLEMSDSERFAYVSGFLWGSAAQLVDAHLQARDCRYPALQHVPADELSKRIALAIAQTPAAEHLSVWIMLNDALISACHYELAL